MNILGIETSCDETSAAVLSGGKLLSNVISSQTVHRLYGGVVPELAARAHQRLIVPIVGEALHEAGMTKRDIDAIAVTSGPGLMGALLVGVNFAKAMAYGLGVPLIGINHMEGHLYSNFIEPPVPDYPFLCLIVSGGHTQLLLVHEPLDHVLLGETRDDAAGEAFDKVAKMLGLGFPGGPRIDALAARGNPSFVRFPRSTMDEGSFEFSFSGIKTSVRYWLRDHEKDYPEAKIPGNVLADISASFQEAVVDVLVEKAAAALKRTRARSMAVAGGVAANSALRRRLGEMASGAGVPLFIPKLQYCTDNAAMIATAARLRLDRGMTSGLALTADPHLSLVNEAG